MASRFLQTSALSAVTNLDAGKMPNITTTPDINFIAH